MKIKNLILVCSVAFMFTVLFSACNQSTQSSEQTDTEAVVEEEADTTAKCGEGKCGDGMESDSTAKCGDGEESKCGEG